MITAAIQIETSDNLEKNLTRACDLVAEAAGLGATFVTLPEYFAWYGAEDRWEEMSSWSAHILQSMSDTAKTHKIYLLAGSILVPSGVKKKQANESFLLSPDGSEVARYRKIHLFDVDVGGHQYRESNQLLPGALAETAKVDEWTVGLSICFDLRFPAHFQRLRSMGVDLIVTPSAFTYETGKAHWLTLIKCRAIETQCYLLAPALSGETVDEKRLFGGASIIDPWGEVIAEVKESEGIAVAEIDSDYISEVRTKMPLGFS